MWASYWDRMPCLGWQADWMVSMTVSFQLVKHEKSSQKRKRFLSAALTLKDAREPVQVKSEQTVVLYFI
jgi:hypothetical protein